MSERDQPAPAGVPSLIDQYKQRRQAWLAQADELVRLRDEVRSAAEREALEIVTAARRDVRRIVVEARRELLVLTAQLHAAIESVDQPSLQAASETGADAQAVAEVLSSEPAIGSTEDLVLGARREVRTVLDEARAEIEALAAEANRPLREVPAALASGPRRVEPPIPTLEAILGSDPLDRQSAAGSLPTVNLDELPVDAMNRAAAEPAAAPVAPWPRPPAPVDASIFDDASAATPAPKLTLAASALAIAPAPVSSFSSAAATAFAPVAMSRTVEEAVSFIVAPPETSPPLATFRAGVDAVPAGRADEPEIARAEAVEPRTFLSDYEETHQARPAWLWVGLFAATGIVAIVGTVWWFTLREPEGTLAPAAAARSEAAAPATSATDDSATPPAPVPAAAPGLAIEVRRTAWVRTVVDGKEDSRVYQAGETRRIVGARAVSIRAGDGGAVFVAVDGRPAEPLGASGTAVTRQYLLVDDRPATPEPAVLAAAPAGAAPAVVPAASPAPPAATRPEAEAPASPSPAPAAAAEGSAPPTGGRADLITAGQQWLDAYQRRDREAMSVSGTDNTSISDERAVTERFPAWQAGVRRDLDDLQLELTGDTALLTARMTERSDSGADHVSRVSQIWVRRGGRWRLADVRIIGEARLNQIIR